MSDRFDVISLGETIVRCPIHGEPMRMKRERTQWSGPREFSSTSFTCPKVECDTVVEIKGSYDIGMTPAQERVHASRKAAQRAEESGQPVTVRKARVTGEQVPVAVTIDAEWSNPNGEVLEDESMYTLAGVDPIIVRQFYSDHLDEAGHPRA